MSNRRKLARDRKPRCKRCGSTELLTKEGYGDRLSFHVCERCGAGQPTARSKADQ